MHRRVRKYVLACEYHIQTHGHTRILKPHTDPFHRSNQTNFMDMLLSLALYAENFQENVIDFEKQSQKVCLQKRLKDF